MALKVELKPHERIIIGACVITNTDQRARLLIEGDKIPIMREKDILTPETDNTPAKLVYLAVQLMYISPDPQVNHGTYFSLVRDIVTAVPPAAGPFLGDTFLSIGGAPVSSKTVAGKPFASSCAAASAT